MPNESDTDGIEFEAPISIPVSELDERHLGLVLVEALGERGVGKPPLVAANIPLTDGIIDSIRSNAKRLGPDDTPLTHVRLKRSVETQTAQNQDVVSQAKRIEVFRGLSATFQTVKQRFEQAVPDARQFIETGEEEALEKLREIKLELDPGFRQTLESVIHDILSDPNRATLFGCLEKYVGGTFDHSLRVFMMGTKLLAKLHNVQAGKFRENKRMMSYALGLLFHDTGMLFVPERIREKTTRIPQDELETIRSMIHSRGLDSHSLSTIMAVNDPRYVYKPHIAKRLQREIEGLQKLVGAGILSESQYQSLQQFPGHSCLCKAERMVLEKHPIWGWEIVRGSGFSAPQALDIVRHHHQRLDMHGYPDLQVEMSLPAQVAAATDVFDALVSERPYAQVKPYDVAFGILNTMTSSEEGNIPQLSRKVYDLFCACVEKYPVGSNGTDKSLST